MSELKTEKHLKDKLYYSDLYDRRTVERCRDLTRLFLRPVKNPPLINGKKPTKEVMDIMSKMLLDFRLLSEKGERWAKKEERIKEWVDRDQAKDELYESAEPMDNITCLTCRSVMRPAHKHLYSSGIDVPDRVLFMYECPRGHLPIGAPLRPLPLNSEEKLPRIIFISRTASGSLTLRLIITSNIS